MFYIHVLKRGWNIAETPYLKKVRHLPQVLSREEVAPQIEVADTPFHRILLMAMYATGARRAEAAHLKISDIDSQLMVVHIRDGNAGKDRDVMLSPKLLEELRAYWRGLQRKPKEWLFHGNRWHTSSQPVTTKVLWSACQIAAERAALSQDNVTFRWRDSAHGNKKRIMTLDVDEFLRRFLLHLLRPGFMRIHNFGFPAYRNRATFLPPCFQLLGGAEKTIASETAPPTSQIHLLWNCPVCGGTVRVVERLSAAQLLPRSPPQTPRCAA